MMATLIQGPFCMFGSHFGLNHNMHARDQSIFGTLNELQVYLGPLLLLLFFNQNVPKFPY